jgi:hypothetical protein
MGYEMGFEAMSDPLELKFDDMEAMLILSFLEPE